MSGYIVLDKSALERLIGDDKEFEVKIKQAALQTIARSRVRLETSGEVDIFLHQKHAFDELVKVAVQKELMGRGFKTKNSGSGYYPEILSDAYKNEIKKHVKKEFNEQQDKCIKEIHKEFYCKCNEKIDEYQEYVDSVMKKAIDKIGDEKFEEIIEDKLEEIIKRKFSN